MLIECVHNITDPQATVDLCITYSGAHMGTNKLVAYRATNFQRGVGQPASQMPQGVGQAPPPGEEF